MCWDLVDVDWEENVLMVYVEDILVLSFPDEGIEFVSDSFLKTHEV